MTTVTLKDLPDLSNSLRQDDFFRVLGQDLQQTLLKAMVRFVALFEPLDGLVDVETDPVFYSLSANHIRLVIHLLRRVCTFS
jgi:hypothetical protein